MSTLTPPSVDLDISKDVSLQLGKDNVVTVKGAKGELKQAIDRDIIVEIKDNLVEFKKDELSEYTVTAVLLWYGDEEPFKSYTLVPYLVVNSV